MVLFPSKNNRAAGSRLVTNKTSLRYFVLLVLGIGLDLRLGVEQQLIIGVTAWQSQSQAIWTMTSSSSTLKAIRNTILSVSSSSSSLSSLKDPSSSSMRSDLFYQSSPPSYPGPSLSSPIVPQQQRRRQLYKDVVVVGGGLAGLSTALYLTQIDPTRRITIIDRNNDNNGSTTASSSNKNNIPGNMASMAAAGMLAPHSERLPKGDYLDLCLASKRMYIDFVALVEGMAYDSGPEGYKYLWNDDNNNGSTLLEPWNIGYVASGGFLAPAFAGDNVATWMPDHNDDDDDDEENNNPKKKKKTTAVWLDAIQVKELEPYLHPDVVGGWWFPEDASVDARRLTCSLKAACIGAGVEFLCGPNNGEVTSLDLQDGVCKGLWIGSRSSRYVSAKAILVANGAWMRNLLPVPLEPHKGQSLSLRMPKDRPPILRRVLFGGDSYIVPKADGRIVIGATVEAGSFDSNVTPAGIMHVLSHALQLVPGLADLPIEETWAGLRPTTPDKGPILGETQWENLFVAGGYWRNGVLLAPKTGHLLATLIASKNNNHDDNEDSNSEIQLSQEDRNMLDAFSWDRFTSPGGGKRMAANSRYAASMYPVHKRQSGTGIAAAVGTELGSYSTARSAREERRIDRESLLFGDGDSSTTTTDNNDNGDNSNYSDDITEDLFEKAALLGMEDATVFEGFDNKNKRRRRPDNEDEEKESPEAKMKTRRKTTIEKRDELDDDDDDEESLKYYYTQQEAALRRPSQQKDEHDNPQKSPALEVVESSTDSDSSSTSTSTFDGSVDAFTVGSATSSASAGENATANINIKDELESIYQSIRNNKSKQDVDLPDQTEEKRPDPGFRIYHVDKKTGESRIVPPYTSQAEFFESLEAEEVSAVKEDESAQGQEEVGVSTSASSSALSDNTNIDGSAKDSSGMSFDGYQKIVDANSSDNRQDELNAMKEARRKNRSKGGIPQIQKKQ